jgi:Bacterial Ig-like domain
MSKTYQIKINQGKDSKSFDIPVAGAKGQALSIKAVAGARYQLIDSATGFAPENIRASRQGKDLKVSFEGSNTTDLVIEDYYKVSSEGYNGLIGESEPGRFYEYIPENASGFSSVPMLAESGQVVGMALGGAEVAPAGAAVGVLAAGIVSPWLLGAGALGAAAAAGGGGGGGGAVAAPVVKSASLLAADDTGPKDNITNNKSPHITGEATAFSDIVLTVAGKTYTGKSDANGIYSIQVDPLSDGVYTPEVTATANGVKSVTKTGTPFTVDTSDSNNYADPAITITSISEDTGLIVINPADLTGPVLTKSDFHTSDTTLVFNGALSGFTKATGDWVELVLKDVTGKVVALDYVQPTQSNGVWTWSWDKTSQALADGKYTLHASIVDGSGNILKTSNQDVFVDTRSSSNGSDTDLNWGIKTSIDISEDTGIDGDFITKGVSKIDGAGYLDIKGVLDRDFASNGDVLLVQVIDKDGKVCNEKYATINDKKNWALNDNDFNYADGNYIIKASIFDIAGNIVSVSQQAFVVDTMVSTFQELLDQEGSFKIQGKQQSDGSLKITDLNVYQMEDGHLTWKFLNSTSEKNYSAGQGFDFSNLQGRVISAGGLEIIFEDLAGNSTTWTNPIKYDFTEMTSEELISMGKSGLKSSTVTPVGAVGTYSVYQQDFDMASLYENVQKIGDRVAVNKLDMLQGDHVVHVTMGDVLAMGVKDSFAIDGHVQLLIDADSKDVLNLDNLVGSDSYDWKDNNFKTVDNKTYHAYINTDFGLEVLVNTNVLVHLV